MLLECSVSDWLRLFRQLRSRLYCILPQECLLKPEGQLSIAMILIFDEATLNDKGVVREDICSLCDKSVCRFNNVADRTDRIARLELSDMKNLKGE